MVLKTVAIAFTIIFLLLFISTRKELQSDTIKKIDGDLRKLDPVTTFYVAENKLSGATFTLAKNYIFICTKTLEYNTLLFVAIHELAHVKSNEVGHGPEFVKTFKHLLKKAIDMGIYRYVDYSREPKAYCNMHIDATVL
jgi:predicted peroxiredoxin